MQNAFDVLEINKIEAELAKFAKSERGKQSSLNLAILSKEDLEKELLFLDETQQLIARYGNFPIDVSDDLRKSLELAGKGYTLSIEELNKVAHEISLSNKIKQYFAKVDDAPLLKEYAKNLSDLTFLEEDIHRIISPNLTIYDDASPKLKSIRINIARAEKKMQQRMACIANENKTYLSDGNSTIKNGHFVLMVSIANKNKVKGILQGLSSSGETAFIEPEAIVEINNEILLLRSEEDEEIKRLLFLLSRKVGENGEVIESLNNSIGYLDFLQAKVLYGESLHGHIGSISKEGNLILINARHPLLDQSKVVPNSFYLSPDKPFVILSGPNAGGKTVALKCVGIICLMFQMGLLIPTDIGAELPYFKNIYVDIGDSQSLEDSLSTFSGHIGGIADILNRVGGKDLVLLDEVGTGTSPLEGEALAQSIVFALLKKHCYAYISSHFEGIKALALEDKRIENASMLFDEEALSPTYKLSMGIPGDSYGLDAARRFGLSEEVIKEASDIIKGKGGYELSKAIKELSTLIKQNQDLIKQEEEKLRVLEAKQEKINKLEEDLLERKKNFMLEINEEREELIEKAKKQIQEIITSLNDNSGIKLHELIKAKADLDKLIEEIPSAHFDEELDIGDYVYLPDFDLKGKVIAKIGNRISIVSAGKQFDVDATSATKIAPFEEEKGVGAPFRNIDELPSAPLPLECNLIGMRAAEAEIALDKYLDSCRAKGYKRVRIVHGFGSGALRKLTHEYLKAHSSFVQSFYVAGEGEGSGGATVVNLK